MRIGPNEISLDDLSVYNDVLYRQNTHFHKVSGFAPEQVCTDVDSRLGG
jgi:hypothetical protein